MKNIAIITARSGSKGIKDKNIKLLNGKPLLAYSIDVALESKMFDRVMVSTDSEKYAEISKKCGAEVPFLRSVENSGDTSGSWDVVKEVLKRYENSGERFETVCLLQPTSPLRTAEDIIKAYKVFENKNANAVTGVCECDHPAEYMMVLGEDHSLDEYRKNEVDLPRQLLKKQYRINGAIFIRKIKYNNEEVHIVCGGDYAYLMDKKKSIDIDDEDDFEYAEYLLRKDVFNEKNMFCYGC